MFKGLAESLKDLKGQSVLVSPYDPNNEVYGDAACNAAPVILSFASGTVVRADYWRIIEGETRISNFDHRQKYGLPSRFDALFELGRVLTDLLVADAMLDSETGDLILRFTPNVTVQIFNFTSYEAWEVRFPNHTVEYSNHVERGL